MAMPNDSRYHARANTEDLIALLCKIQDHQKTALILAFRGEGPEAQDAIFLEMRQQAQTIRDALRIVQAHWCEIQAVIEAAKD